MQGAYPQVARIPGEGAQNGLLKKNESCRGYLRGSHGPYIRRITPQAIFSPALPEGCV